jgi:hypothetical protein
MHFTTKSYLKNNHNHTAKQTLNERQTRCYEIMAICTNGLDCHCLHLFLGSNFFLFELLCA